MFQRRGNPMRIHSLISALTVLVFLGLAGLARAEDKPAASAPAPSPAFTPAVSDSKAVRNFTSGFDAFSDKPRPFPDKFEMFDFSDQKATIAFGPDQPWRLINFWAAWCPPCIAELPSLKALQTKSKLMKGFKVVLLSADMPVSGAALKYLLGQKNIPMFEAYYLKDFNLWESFDVSGLPTTILVTPQGQIVYTFTGDADWNSQDSMAFLRAVLPPSALQ
jgi:thiol-disulfide isomerase/thioredoxin